MNNEVVRKIDYCAVAGVGMITNIDGIIDLGYIPKEIRNQGFVKNAKHPATGQFLSERERDPDDRILQMMGYNAVNPARVKKIFTEADMQEAR